ncbi:hypothetical protein PENSPDRAFT_689388 [Peniophora sp. CONT]|nr:hypothetical protein PENSPDRAFT_689388 [Peniophora sp. CONT]
MAWDVAAWSLEENIERLREHYGAQSFPPELNIAQELGADGEGTFNMLASSGIDEVISKGSLVWYVGNDGGHPAPWVDRLFEYDVDAIAGDDAADEGDQGPDDPTWMAPSTGVEMWVGEVVDVYSMDCLDAEGNTRLGEDGFALRRTFLIMAGYISVRDLIQTYPSRWERIIDVLELMHPREHLKTDLWEATRAHYVSRVGSPTCLCDVRAFSPPPLMSTLVPRVFTVPGAVHNLDPVRNAIRRRPLQFRQCPGFQLVTCAVERCPSAAYNRRTDTMALCTNCGAWFHPGCAERGVGAFHGLLVEWTGGMLVGPVTRRAPNNAPAVLVEAARGLRLRVDPPVRTWERVSCGIESARLSIENVEETDGAGFRVAWRNEVQLGGVFGGTLTDEEVEEAVHEIEAGGPEENWDVLVCPLCGENA